MPGSHALTLTNSSVNGPWSIRDQLPCNPQLRYMGNCNPETVEPSWHIAQAMTLGYNNCHPFFGGDSGRNCWDQFCRGRALAFCCDANTLSLDHVVVNSHSLSTVKRHLDCPPTKESVPMDPKVYCGYQRLKLVSVVVRERRCSRSQISPERQNTPVSKAQPIVRWQCRFLLETWYHLYLASTLTECGFFRR